MPAIDTAVRVLNSELQGSAFQHTWSYDHVLEYGPLGRIQCLRRTFTHVSYLDCIHEVWLEFTDSWIEQTKEESKMSYL